MECEPATAIQSDQLVKSVSDELFLKCGLEGERSGHEQGFSNWLVLHFISRDFLFTCSKSFQF